jgi:hypothetical protein
VYIDNVNVVLSNEKDELIQRRQEEGQKSQPTSNRMIPDRGRSQIEMVAEKAPFGRALSQYGAATRMKENGLVLLADAVSRQVADNRGNTPIFSIPWDYD